MASSTPPLRPGSPARSAGSRNLALACCLLLLLAWGLPAVAPAAPANPPHAPSSVYGAAPTLKPGAITVHPYGQMQQSDSLDDYDTAPAASIADPLEPWNRFWFHFNDIFYLYIAKPAYNAWVFITPARFAAVSKTSSPTRSFPCAL